MCHINNIKFPSEPIERSVFDILDHADDNYCFTTVKCLLIIVDSLFFYFLTLVLIKAPKAKKKRKKKFKSKVSTVNVNS